MHADRDTGYYNLAATKTYLNVRANVLNALKAHIFFKDVMLLTLNILKQTLLFKMKGTLKILNFFLL